MEESEMEKLEKYLYNEVTKIVDILFQKLEENNIDVELERNELNEKELKAYINIYNEYEKALVGLKEIAISKFGYIEKFDFIYAVIIQEVVKKKGKEQSA